MTLENEKNMDSAKVTEKFFQFAGADVLLERIIKESDFRVSGIRQIKTGMNNGVFVLRSNTNERLVAKFYTKDERNCLERERKACGFLYRNNFSVPRIVMSDNDYGFAVYTFIDGKPKQSGELTKKEVRSLIDLIVDLQQFRLDDSTKIFNLGVHAQLSYDDVIAMNVSRLEKIKSALLGDKLDLQVGIFLESTGIVEEISRLAETRMRKWRGIRWQLGSSDLRLSPIDFGIHNALFKENNLSGVVDLEYFGWDDPLKAVSDFIAHDSSLSLSDQMKIDAVDYYIRKKDLSIAEQQRLNLLIDMTNIEWITIYLQSLTSEYIKKRMFSAGARFELDQYIYNQIQKTKMRYESVKKNVTCDIE